ncbi:MAG: hypothetical protein AB2L14_16355 [Candidatus Xenobiia bacterium LiM19]
MRKKQLLLFFIFFVFTFCVYLSTLSDNLSYQSDYIQIPISVEKLTEGTVRPLFHVLWAPLGKAVYSKFTGFGYAGRSVRPIELLNIVFASAGSALFAVLLFDVTGSIIISICLAMLLSFSYPLWQEFTHTKLYSGGLLFTVICFYLYTRENIRFKPLVYAAVNGTAFLFHVSNVFLIPATCVYLLSLNGRLRDRVREMLSFIFLLCTFTAVSYILIFRLTNEHFELSTFLPSLVSYYESTWIDYCKFNFLFSLGIDPDRADLSQCWPLLAGPALYLLILALLLFSTGRELYRSPLFHSSLFYAVFMTAGGVLTSQRNPNIFLSLTGLHIIFALSLACHRRLSKVWLNTIAVFLIIFSFCTLLRNYQSFASMKRIDCDFIYTGIIVEPGSLISDDDLLVANSSISYYFTYYKRCRAIDIDAYVSENMLDSLLAEIRNVLAKEKRVWFAVDTVPIGKDALIRPIGIMEPDSLIDLLSREFILKPVYRSSDKRFLIFTVERKRFIIIRGSLAFRDRKGPTLSRAFTSSGKEVSLYFFQGLTASMNIGGRRRAFRVPVNERSEFELIIPVTTGQFTDKIDRIVFKRPGYEEKAIEDIPVRNDRVHLGKVHME